MRNVLRARKQRGLEIRIHVLDFIGKHPSPLLFAGGMSSSDILETHPMKALLVLPLSLAFAVAFGDVLVAKSACINTAKGMRWKDLISRFPTKAMVLTWAKRHGRESQSSSLNAYDRILLQLPKGAAADLKPTKGSLYGNRPEKFRPKFGCVGMLRALEFANVLKNGEHFVEGLQAAVNYVNQTDFAEDDETLNASDHPSRRTIRRALQRLDCTSMLIDRRKFLACYKTGRLLSLHFFSDGSCTRGIQIPISFFETMLCLTLGNESSMMLG